jgi:hypothetical protein
LWASFALRREDAKVFFLDVCTGGMAIMVLRSSPWRLCAFARNFSLGFGKDDVVSCSLIPIFADSA